MATIVVVLVFDFKNDKDRNKNTETSKEVETSTPTDNESISGGNNTNNNTPEIEPDTQIYATELVLNLPETIDILLNNKIELLDGFVTVVPTEAKSKISYSISSYYTTDLNGLKLEGNTLVGLKVDTYKLNVSVPKKTGNITKSVIIRVYEDKQNSHITQIKNTAIVGDNLNIDTYFQFNSNLSYTIKHNGLINFSDNKIIPLSAGISNLKFELVSGYIKYFYNFELIIKDVPEYHIVVNDLIDNTLHVGINKAEFINFVVKNRAEESVNQPVNITIGDETIANYEFLEYPLIKIKAKAKGNTTLTISCVNNLSIFVTINIIVT